MIRPHGMENRESQAEMSWTLRRVTRRGNSSGYSIWGLGLITDQSVVIAETN